VPGIIFNLQKPSQYQLSRLLFLQQVIATAKASRMLCEEHLLLHLQDIKIKLVVYEFESSTMTNIAQFCVLVR
jgi:hypothetical protein